MPYIRAYLLPMRVLVSLSLFIVHFLSLLERSDCEAVKRKISYVVESQVDVTYKLEYLGRGPILNKPAGLSKKEISCGTSSTSRSCFSSPLLGSHWTLENILFYLNKCNHLEMHLIVAEITTREINITNKIPPTFILLSFFANDLLVEVLVELEVEVADEVIL